MTIHHATPIELFSAEQATYGDTPYVFFSPHRYIQGPGVLERLGSYLSMIGRAPAILISAGGFERYGSGLEAELQVAVEQLVFTKFGGECSHEEIQTQVAHLQQSSVDCLIVVGGGKCIDAGKCIAAELGIPVVICPTIASTDAPCSAVSVIYTEQGVFKDVQFHSTNPAMVVVDTRVIAQAPLRYFLAGMADALATGYEVRTCADNSKARSMVGGKISLAAAAIARLSTETIYEYADAAIEAAKNSEVTLAMERVVEANTLLSGIGFESGGLAAAHAIASGLTAIPEVDANFLHGEMVAIGLQVQLILEGNQAEYIKVRDFFTGTGLPTSFSQLGIDASAGDSLEKIASFAAGIDFINNEPFEISSGRLTEAMLKVEQLARQ